jgi:predicted nucleic acid-binding protein
VIAVDTSIVVAAFAVWHEAHQEALRVLDRAPRLPGHAALETYSVLTRLPGPERAMAVDVHRYLEREFKDPWLVLPASELAALVSRLAALGIAGGATYDALIGATVEHAGATLVTRDVRARRIYERLGVEVEFVG